MGVRAVNAVRDHRRRRARRLPCGWTLDESADLLYLYYGAADSVTGLATARFSEVQRVCDAPMPMPSRSELSDRVDSR